MSRLRPSHARPALLLGLGVLAVGLPPGRAHAQDRTQARSAASADIEAGESDADVPPREFVRWNEYEGPFSTLRFGGGFLFDYAAYSQDEESKQQIELTDTAKLRDFRFLLKGKLEKLERGITWSAGIMYDAPTESWVLRQTGIMIPLPKASSSVFVGRTKEGFSMNKVMVGYHGWTMERPSISDATIPILADGIKWLGYLPKRGFNWSLGWYGDRFSSKQSFSTYQQQYATRLSWLPIRSDLDRTLLHVGLSLRYGVPEDHELQLRARPEAFPAPYFVDTGKFPADRSRTMGLEAYYRSGPLLLGGELFVQHTDSEPTGNPTFDGGEVVASWMITGETRAYKANGAYFLAVSPDRPVFQGGPGAIEAVLRASYIDLDGGTLRGGKFWRITPMINWYLSDSVRLELAYGYGELDRFDLTGTTRFLQARIQLTL